ncbi:MAG: DUF7352 domain-containing protein [Limnohabitans sp.]
MKTIWKYEIVMVAAPTVLDMPDGARLLGAGMQQGVAGAGFVAWFEVDPSAPSVSRAFRIVGTGHDIPSGWAWRATVQDEPFVWHLYEKEQG